MASRPGQTISPSTTVGSRDSLSAAADRQLAQARASVARVISARPAMPRRTVLGPTDTPRAVGGGVGDGDFDEAQSRGGHPRRRGDGAAAIRTVRWYCGWPLTPSVSSGNGDSMAPPRTQRRSGWVRRRRRRGPGGRRQGSGPGGGPDSFIICSARNVADDIWLPSWTP